MVRSNKVTIEDLNKSWLGFSVIRLFIIDLRNMAKNQLLICKEYHIQPSEINKMQFWWYEWTTDEIREITKEQEKQQKEQEKEQKAMQSSMNMNNMMRNAQQSAPKMPSFSSMNMPQVQMPRL